MYMKFKKGLVINALSLGLIFYEVEKEVGKSNMLTIKFVTNYAILLKSILLIPMFLAYTSFINSSLGLSTSLQIVLAILSFFSASMTIANAILFMLFIRDNSPFSKLPFASSVNYQE